MKAVSFPSIKDISIKNKLITVFVVIILIPFVVLAVFYSYYIQDTLKNRIIANHKEITKQTGQNVNIILKDMTTTARLVIANKDMQEVLSNNIYDNPANIFSNIKMINNFFMDVQYSVLNYSNSFAAVKDGYSNIHISQAYYQADMVEKLKKFLEGYSMDKLEDTCWIGNIRNEFFQNGSTPFYVTMLKKITYERTDNSGAIMVCVDEKNFYDVIKSNNSDPGTNIYIVDETGSIISSTRRDDIFQKCKRSDIIMNSSRKDVVFVDDRYNKEVINTYRLANGKWHIVEVIPYSVIYRDINKARLLFFSIGGIFLVIFIFISVSIMGKITKPVIDLTIAMNKVQDGDLGVRVLTNGRDEVGQLSEAFNNMILRINELIIRINEEQKEKRDVELKMLRAQVSPHFLFNTLNSIRWVAEMSQAKHVSELIVALSSLLKNSIMKNKEFVALDEEIQNLKNYCKIQECRYGGVFDINYNIEDKALRCKVLNLILQPIVENSLIHGFEGMLQNGIINIDAGIEGNDLVVKVEDNGRGMNRENINELLMGNSQVKDGGSRIGVLNVHERLRINYGEDYGLKMYGETGKGVTTVIKIPVDLVQGADDI